VIIGIPKEISESEKRVSSVPEVVKKWVKKGHRVLVESGAGSTALFSDDDYRTAGAEIISERKDLFSKANLILKISADGSFRKEIDLLKEETVLVGFLQPFVNLELIKKFAEKKITTFAMELIPRITRAQPMDALTSQSMIAGYKAVLFAAEHLQKFMPLMMTAAMTVRPAKVLVIGAGVAGLQAIATARRLGAVVKGVDTRPTVKEQVESLGASFVVLPVHAEAEEVGGYAKDLGEEFYRTEQEFILPHLTESDIVITTAQIPGRRAPVLITEGMVEKMKPGSVIVDLAIDTGGNCSLSQSGKVFEKSGVIIYGFANAPSSMPYQASIMYSKNIDAFLNEIIGNRELKIDMENEIIRSTLVTFNGEIVNEKVKEKL
jgi:NAD(P) transhydrogenase subunit alpha